MTPTDTIEMAFSDLARAVDHGSVKVAERLPSPIDAAVLRLGALNAEAIRQTGLVTVTNIDAVRGVVNVAWTGVSDLAAATETALEESGEDIADAARSSLRTARRAGNRIADQAKEAAGDVERNFSVVGDAADKAEDDVEREGRKAGRRMTKAADTGVAETAEAGADTPEGGYANWTKDELYERAQELDVDGRSGMSKDELITAIERAS